MKPENRYEVRPLNEDRNWYGVYDIVEASRGASFGFTHQGLVYRGTEIACHAWAEAVTDALEAIEANDLADQTETAELEPLEAVPV